MSMAMFELVPATIGMNECEIEMWPQWPLHASFMFLVFWVFYAIDRMISMISSNIFDERLTRMSGPGYHKFVSFIKFGSKISFENKLLGVIFF